MSEKNGDTGKPGNSIPTSESKRRPGTLGPLSDLERHLPGEWWRTLFNAMYLQTDGDVVENKEITAHEVDAFLRAVPLARDARILDLCCGQGRHLIELASRGYSALSGVDRSRYLVRVARRRARQGNFNIDFHEGDARKFRAKVGGFDCVTMLGNSFGFFERDTDDLEVLKSVIRVLKSGGTLYLDIADGAWLKEHYERRSWEWIDKNQFVCRERTLSEDGRRLVSREVVTHADQGVVADQFYAERLYTRDQIRVLLERAGFQNVVIQEPYQPETDHKEDLGMMGRRLILSAKAPERVSVKQRSGPRPLTVLLGDPRRPDEVKLGGVFSDQDMDTVQRLKTALVEIGAFDVTYLDEHATLLDTLRRDRPAISLNLCDEGFMNDAFKELHVPAFMEAFDLRYTGAGPACLGLCYDKGLVRAIAESMDIPVPLETYINPDDRTATIPSVLPAMIKPATGDSSIGITQDAVVHTPEEALRYVGKLRETMPERAILVQEYLTGDEYTVGLIGNPGIRLDALPILMVDYSKLPADLPKILSYESKWQPDSPYWTEIGYKEALLPDNTRRDLVDRSMRLFERLGCRDYARFDFRADANGEMKLLEVNPNPGWCWDGKMNLMAGFAGMTYSEMLLDIIEAAEARYAAADSLAQVTVV